MQELDKILGNSPKLKKESNMRYDKTKVSSYMDVFAIVYL